MKPQVMTILRLKNPTNIYRIDAKKLGGERGYLALEDLRIKSTFARSNMLIREVGRSGERKNPRGRRKKRKNARAERLGRGKNKGSAPVTLAPSSVPSSALEWLAPSFLPCHLPRSLRAQELGASINGVELRVHILKSFLQGSICEKLSKKG